MSLYSAGYIRNAVSSGTPDALGLLGLSMKEKFQRMRLETKSLKSSKSSATLGTCSLQEVAASWLRSHAANVHGANSANLLPLLTNRHLPLLTRGKVYSSCVRSVMLHAAETWVMKVDTLNSLRRNDRAMIPWICNVRAKNEVSSDSLLTKLGIQDLDVVLRTSRMRWFGHVHVERSTGWIEEVRKLNVVAKKRSGRPRKSWDEVLENDRKKLGWILLTLKIILSGEDAFEKDLSKSPTLGRGKQGSKMDMMMMMSAIKSVGIVKR